MRVRRTAVSAIVVCFAALVSCRSQDVDRGGLYLPYKSNWVLLLESGHACVLVGYLGPLCESDWVMLLESGVVGVLAVDVLLVVWRSMSNELHPGLSRLTLVSVHIGRRMFKEIAEIGWLLANEEHIMKSDSVALTCFSGDVFSFALSRAWSLPVGRSWCSCSFRRCVCSATRGGWIFCTGLSFVIVGRKFGWISEWST